MTGEFFDRGRTARGGLYTGADTMWLQENDLRRDAFNMKIGQSKATVGATFYNAVNPLGGGAQLYSFGGLSYRRGKATGFYRLPGSQPERVVFELYPNGFLPQINPDIRTAPSAPACAGPRGPGTSISALPRGATASSGISRIRTTPPWGGQPCFLSPNGAEREVIRGTLFNREERNRFEDALPRTKFNLSARYNLKRVGIPAAATYYGSAEYKPTNQDHEETFGGKTLIDLDVACEVIPGGQSIGGSQQPVEHLPGRARKRGQHRLSRLRVQPAGNPVRHQWGVLLRTSESGSLGRPKGRNLLAWEADGGLQARTLRRSAKFSCANFINLHYN